MVVQSSAIMDMILLTYCTILGAAMAAKSGPWEEAEIKYEWVTVDFDWPSEEMKEQYIHDGRFDPTHNLISGIKTYKGNVYVTVPRLKYTTGVPSTLNQVVMKEGKPVLRPFPNWEAQQLGDCSALQCAMSMEVDPLTGLIYVIDPGRSGVFGNMTGQPEPTYCPTKLVVYDLNDGSLVLSYNFPEDVVHKKTNFLNDIVLDRGYKSYKSAMWVYITDAGDNKLVIYNVETNRSRAVYDKSMDYDPGEGSDITVNGITYKLKIPIDGLAMSSDFQFVYYCALGSKTLYQVSTEALRFENVEFSASVRLVGAKISQTGGMTYGTDNLYYGALTRNAVYRWEVTDDEISQGTNASCVVISTETEIARDDEKLVWPDSLTIDEDGYFWFTACRAQLFLLGGMDFSGGHGPNYRIWRVNISEKSYLAPP